MRTGGCSADSCCLRPFSVGVGWVYFSVAPFAWCFGSERDDSDARARGVRGGRFPGPIIVTSMAGTRTPTGVNSPGQPSPLGRTALSLSIIPVSNTYVGASFPILTASRCPCSKISRPESTADATACICPSVLFAYHLFEVTA